MQGRPAGFSPEAGRHPGGPGLCTKLVGITGFPGWRLHPLSGNLDGLWSLTVTGNRRIVFRFYRGNAYDVDLVDDH